MKYIAYINGHDMPDIILFSPMVEHKAIAAGLGDVKILGAGFVRFYPSGAAECYDESTSLDIKSRLGLDDAILRRLIKLATGSVCPQ